ncbi:LexA family transcriptional regulator [Desulfovibrio inopinatus]|uniref:LexA family transcriptional regulator n=1 Tax=Desulfovibrio inopinatus TaxID=102109 RepID=UPI000425619D|nr:S24 family peptidase [Desulfovibrio inopinatus]
MTHLDFDTFYARVCQATGIDSQSELADKLRVHRSAITQAKKKKSVPEKWILRLSRMYAIDADWLMTGRKLGGRQSCIENAPEFHRIPKVAARLSAGGGSLEVEDNIEFYQAFRLDWLRRKGNPEMMALLDVVGNSMEPEIKEGDTVLVDESQNQIIQYAVFAVGVEDSIMVKRLEQQPGKIRLLSDNRDYSPIEVRGDELHSFRIIGRVVWVGRELCS